jgi:hypothetical protein
LEQSCQKSGEVVGGSVGVKCITVPVAELTNPSCTDMLLVNITLAHKQILSTESKPPSFFLREMVVMDTKKDKETGHITTISLKKKDGGLLSELKICLCAKVLLTSNISVQDGLVNSATGTVMHFTPTLPPTTSPDF